MKSELPKNLIYRNLKGYFNCSISNEYVLTVKYVLEGVLDSIAIDTLNQFNDINELREFHSIKPLRRVSNTHFNSVKYLKLCVNDNSVSEDSTNRDTPISKAVGIL